MPKKPVMHFMGLELFGKDVGGPDEQWETDVKRFGRDLPFMIVLGKSVNFDWYAVVTCRSKCLQFSVQHAPSRRVALMRLRNSIRLAQDDLAAFGGGNA